MRSTIFIIHYSKSKNISTIRYIKSLPQMNFKLRRTSVFFQIQKQCILMLTVLLMKLFFALIVEYD